MNNKHTILPPKNMHGAVSVEMALLLIPLIVMAFGVAEFGRAIFEYNTLAKSTRDSVRMISQLDPSPTNLNYPASIIEAKCLAVHGTLDCSGPKLLTELSTDMVQIVSAPDAATGINMVTVTITGYAFKFVYNPLIFFGDGSTDISFGNIHSTMRQL